MATVAFLGSQTLLKIGNAASPEVFTTIGEVTSIGAIGQRNDLVEVTHMLSTAKEYIGGLPDGQEVEVGEQGQHLCDGQAVRPVSVHGQAVLCC